MMRLKELPSLRAGPTAQPSVNLGDDDDVDNDDGSSSILSSKAPSCREHDLASERDEQRPTILDRNSGLVEDGRLKLVRELAHRASSLRSILEFVCILLNREEAFAKIEGLRNAYIHDTGLPVESWPDLSFFEANRTQTCEVTYRVLVPLSSYHACAFSEILSRFTPCLARMMVSHTWGNKFLDTVAACVAAAQGKTYYFHLRPMLRSVDRVLQLIQELEPRALETTFWLCAFSVNQHKVGCNKSPWPCRCSLPKVPDGPESEVASFHVMMHYLSQKCPDFIQAIAIDDVSEVDVIITADDARTGVQTSSDSSGSWWSNKSVVPCHGITVDWKYCCVRQVNDLSNVQYSRRVFVGDVVRSANGATSIEEMKVAMQQDRMELVLHRTMSVTTRIWVVAEIAEAHSRGIQQLGISKFPMAFSGPEQKVRVRAADVMKAEASRLEDRERILANVSAHRDEYNKRLKKTLLATPWSKRLMSTVLFYLAISAYVLVQLVRSLATQTHFVASYYVCWLALALFVLAALLYAMMYMWLMKELNEPSRDKDLQQEIRDELRNCLRPSHHILLVRPFLVLKFGLASSLHQRLISYFTVVSIPLFLLLSAGLLFLQSDPECARSDLLCNGGAQWSFVSGSFGLFCWLWTIAAIEQHLALKARPGIVISLFVPLPLWIFLFGEFVGIGAFAVVLFCGFSFATAMANDLVSSHFARAFQSLAVILRTMHCRSN